jgi:HEAT repeats
MSSPFESYDDLEDANERLQAADPAERRVAIIALGHSGDPAAVPHVARMVSDPDAGVRQQVAMALGEFDGPEAASALVILLVDPERIVASAAADSMAEFKDPGLQMPSCRLSRIRCLQRNPRCVRVCVARGRRRGAGRRFRLRLHLRPQV